MTSLPWTLMLVAVCAPLAHLASEELVLAETAGAVITVSTSGHIMSFGRPGGRNLLWRHPDPLAHPVGGWLNRGGDKLWLWPQQRWEELSGAAWPPPAQAEGWRVTVAGGHVHMESPAIARTGIRFVRDIELDPRETACRIVNRLERSDSGRVPVAVWAVTQLPTPLAVLAPAGTRSHAVSGREPWRRDELPDGGVHLVPGPGKSKLGLDAAGLTILYPDGSLELTASSTDAGAWGDGERAQVYGEADGSPDLPPGCPGYVEAEFTAPLRSGTVASELSVAWRWIPR